MFVIGRALSCAALRGALVLAALSAASPAAFAQTTKTLVVAKDATIRGGSYASHNYGDDAVLETRASADSSYDRRATLTFDTDTTIPAGSSIQSAKLTLTVASGSNSESRTLSAYTIPISFDEDGVTWKVRKSGIAWSYPGGDVASLAPASGTVYGTSGSTVTFDVTAAVQKVVTGAYGSRYARFLIMDEGGTSRDSYKAFHSAQSSDSPRRPHLEVVYGGSTAATGAGEVVLSAAAAAKRAGKWALLSDSSAIGGAAVRHPDAGATKVTTALASPADYFDITFTAQAGVPYRLWIHGKAQDDSWANDSVHVQFSGSVTRAGSPTYRIGTTSSTEVNLEDCNDCGVSGWMWQDNGWGGPGVLGPAIYFAASGTQTIRIQTREDGLEIDQILLSPSQYLTSEPPAVGGSSTPDDELPPPPPPADEPAPSTTSSLRVLHWNVHHGVGTDGKYDIDRIATWIAKMKPDVVTLNEVEKYTGWGNEDQPARYKSMLQSKTGKTWYMHFTQEFGDWSSNGKGHVILSVYPFTDTDHTALTPSSGLKGAGAAGRVSIVVNGRPINVVVSHLDPESQTMRLTQAKETIAWALTFPENRIITGDMNAWPDQSSIAEFNKTYYDSWAVAESKGTAYQFSGLSPSGATKKGRIDYIFYSRKASSLVLKSSQVYDTRDSSGVMPSDHRPVLSTFEVR